MTTATGTPESNATLGAAASLLTGADIARLDTPNLSQVLATLTDVPIFATGQVGAASSVFLRGANSDETLFLVDGIRFNDANVDYGLFLGGWHTGPWDHLEVVYGPQSTLYGAEAAGGVISLSTEKGAGRPTAAASVEGGSHDTVQGYLTAQGISRGWAYDAAVAGGHTNNDRRDNGFDTGNFVLRLDRAVFSALSIGATLRGLESHYQDPGDIYTNAVGNSEREQDWIGTVFGDLRVSDNLTIHATAGGVDRTLDTLDSGALTEARQTRGVLSAQATARLTATNRLTAGVDAEREQDRDDGFGSIDRRQGLWALFAEDEWQPMPDVYVTGGVRRDDYSTYGAADTGRATLAWLGGDHVLKLRGSYGTGFNSPSFLELYSRSPYFAGNPALQPERSSGWDVGLDAYLPQNQTVSITWFRTDYRNLIESNFSASPATSINVGQARTQGLEVSVVTPWAGAFQTRIGYAYLEARDLTAGADLLRRPRNSVSVDAVLDAGNGWTIGMGGSYVGRRPDIDPLSFATIEDPDYTVFRSYVVWHATPRLTIGVRIENSLDHAYAPVAGYPAPGRAYYGRMGWSF